MSASIFKLATDWRFHACLLLLAAGLLAAALPLGSAMEFNADEGMELSKALIYARHPGLVSRLWNDQPALYTEVLSAAFKLFSPRVLVARLVAVAFGALITLSIWGVVAELADRTSGVWAALFFLLSPAVLDLGVSTMIELPAFALALASFWMSLASLRQGSWRLLAGSALLYGCALNIKLTPVLMLPAVCAHWMLVESKGFAKLRRPVESTRAGETETPRYNRLAPLAVWLVSTGAVWALLLCAIPPGGNWALLWGSHAKAGAAFLARNPDLYHFPAGEYFGAHVEGTLGAVIGCYVLASARRWSALVFPAALLSTLLVAHGLHRPWWWYYWLHFAIPISMLAGMGARELVARAGRTAPETWREAVRPFYFLTALACLASTVVVQGIPRFAARYSELRNSPRIEQSALLKEIRKYKPRARWLYSLDAKYSFYSQIPSPPELAVLPLKRFYAGAISFPQILARLKEDKVEEILTLAESDPDGEWSRFLTADYVRVFQEQGYALYIAKAILP